MRKHDTTLWKRLLALALALSMLASWMPQQASAQETEVVTDSGDLVMEGTNGLGTLLSQRLTQAEEEARLSQTQGGCVITDLAVQGNTATVEFVTAEDAMLVVAIYDENQNKLLCSGNARVTQEQTSVQVTIEGEMPAYFRARAYLADSYDLTPLCQAYETPMYTQAMQELLASSAADYEEDRVLQLEAEGDTNFLVYSEETLRINVESGVNALVSADYENQIYVFGNADEQLTGLEIGDIFSCEYGDGEILIVKVASLEADGDGTVTVTGGQLQLDEVFDYIKIEAQANTNDAEVTVPEDSCFTYLDNQAPLLYAYEDDDAPDVIYHRIGIRYPEEDYKPGYTESTDFSISGSLTIFGTGGFDLYSADGSDFIRFSLDMDLGFDLIVTGAARLPTSPFAKIKVKLLGGVTMYLLPTLELSFSGSVDFRATAEWDMGFIWEVGTLNFTNVGTPLRIRPMAELSVTVFVGLDLRPTLALIHDKIFNVEISIPVGLEVELKTTGTDFEETLAGSTDHAQEKHSCRKCLEIKGSLMFRISATVEFWNKKLGNSGINITVPLWSFDAYYSISHGSFAFTQCPYKEYLVCFQVQDPKGQPAYNAAVVIGQEADYTDENGLMKAYLNPGTHIVRVAWGDYVKDSLLEVTGPVKAAIRLGSDSRPDFNFGVFEDADFVDEDIRDHGEIVFSEKYGNVTSTLYKDGHLAIRGKGEMTYAIAYAYRSEVKSVSIESGVTGIHTKAFAYYSNLKKVTIAGTVATIGEGAFYGCTALTKVTLGKGVTTIGKDAFYGCTGLSRMEIPGSVAEIGNTAFYKCTGLLYVKLGYGVTTIGSSAFSGCTGLEEIDLPDTLITIGEGAFYGCAGLKTVEIPDSVTEIGDRAFQECTGLLHLKMGRGAATIGDYAFWGCTGLTDADLGTGITTLGKAAFCNCSRLKEIRLPDSLVSIGESVFDNCTGLVSVDLGNGLQTIGDYAFDQCTGLTSIEFPDSLTSIGRYAFQTAGLTNLTFGSSPVSVGEYAFSGCQYLENVYAPSLEAWLSIEYSADEWLSLPMQYAEHLYLGGAEPVDVVIPEGTERIGPWAFYNCKSLRTVTFPDSVTTIGDHAFHGCSGLTSVRLPNRLTQIAAETFSDCSALSQITIPGSVTSIGGGAFANTGLRSVAIPDSVQTIGGSAFANCKKLSAVLVGNGVTSIEKHAFYATNTLAMVVFRGNAPQIDANAFERYSPQTGINPTGYYPAGNVTWATTPAVNSVSWKSTPASGALTASLFWTLDSEGTLRILGLGQIPDFAAGKAPWAAYAPQIKAVEVGDSRITTDNVTAIGANAFSGCTALTDISIRDTVTSIGSGAFSGCTGLKDPVLPGTLTSIGSGAFRDCSGLVALVIPANVTSLGSEAFAGCSALADISFPGDAPAIGAGAFEGNTLTASYLAGNTTWTDAVKQSYGGNITWMGVEQLDSGSCGDDLRWILTAEGKLIITGNGPMYSWSVYKDFWIEYKSLIREVVIHKGATTIGDRVFMDCTNLVTITLPEGLATIGTSAFEDCRKLTSINIPVSLTEISNYAFSGCNNLHTVRAVNLESWLNIQFGTAANPMYHDADLYFGNTLVTSVTIPASIGTVKNNAFSGCTSLRNLKLEEGITAVGHKAFNGCTALESITLPATLTQVGEYAFSACDNLRTVRAISLERWLNTSFANKETPLINGADLYFGDALATSITIPASAEALCDYVFAGCTSLTHVTLEEGITGIGSNAFSGCVNLQTVSLPASLSSIGTYCFYECEKLNSLELPDSLAEIPYYAFAYCRALTDITIPGSVAQIGSNAFSGCIGLKNVVLREGVTTVGYMAFSYCRGLKEITLPSTLTTFEGAAFYNADSIEKVYAASLDSWLGIQFSDLRATPLSSGGDLYINGVLLTDLVIPAAVTELKNYAFYCCYSLQSVRIPAGVTVFGTDVFRGSALTSVTVEDGVAQIPEKIFSDCSEINQVVFLGAPPQIAGNAFDSYANITAYYPAGNASWTEDVRQNYGATITWVPGLPPVENLELSQTQDAPTLDAVFGGDYGIESTGEKTASFTGLVPGEEYLLVCLVSLDVENLLAPGNLLYIEQGTALEDGTLSFRYIPRTSVETCYVMACGPSGLDLSDAEVTFPLMGAGESPKAVEATVICDGKRLVEGRDYVLLGDVTYQNQGEYVVTVLGIHNYSGAVVCSYTVLAECCPNNPETGEHNWADANCEEPKTCILCGETQGDELGHKFENGTCIRCGDADPDYVNPDASQPTDPAPTDPKPTEPKPTEPAPTDPEPTDPPATEPKPTEPKPTDPTEPDTPKTEGVTRLAGADRLVTSYLVADQLKAKMGVEKFRNIIVASGGTFADALPGSYLSAVKNAPILLTLAKDKYVNQTADYIKANLASGGTVYILGGESAVPKSMEAALAGLNVQRVAGKDRFGTNLEILKVAGVKAGDEILVCTAKEFADSLSASATGKPILLVYKKITDEQKAYLATLSGNSFCVVGGTTAVPDTIAKAMENYGSVYRLAGKDRLETSTMVAEKYFASAKAAVVAYGWNFPDGLCGGSLAYAMDAPLILTHSKTKLYTFTADYTTRASLKAGFVLGGDGLVSDEATRAIFGLGNEPINVQK